MKNTQYTVIGNLLTRKRGATALDLMLATASTCVHKRMSEMKERGWSIHRHEICGKSHGRYFGTAPK